MVQYWFHYYYFLWFLRFNNILIRDNCLKNRKTTFVVCGRFQPARIFATISTKMLHFSSSIYHPIRIFLINTYLTTGSQANKYLRNFLYFFLINSPFFKGSFMKVSYYGNYAWRVCLLQKKKLILKKATSC